MQPLLADTSPSRVLPAGDSIKTATGYSFPSGHTMMAASQYGGVAVGCWKKLRWISVLCMIFIALTGFSRNYLGVHTPQDVIVGLAVSILVMWGVAVLFRYLSAHPEKENIFLALGIVIGVATMIFISVKPYPMDYVDGTLLVDPQKMIRDDYTNNTVQSRFLFSCHNVVAAFSASKAVISAFPLDDNIAAELLYFMGAGIAVPAV